MLGKEKNNRVKKYSPYRSQTHFPMLTLDTMDRKQLFFLLSLKLALESTSAHYTQPLLLFHQRCHMGPHLFAMVGFKGKAQANIFILTVFKVLA